MAIDQNATYPVGTLAPTADYPEGSAVNSTVPGALDGYPLEKVGINDLLGFQQALLRAAGQSADGNADTALASQYLQGVIELAAGRASNYDDSGAADAYVLDVQANQQAPAGLFDGQELNFIPANTNTGACTANPFAQGITDIKLPGGTLNPAAGRLTAGDPVALIYRAAPSAHLELQDSDGDVRYVKVSDQKASGVDGGTFTLGVWQTRDLNTEDHDAGALAALAANQVTLQPGTYRFRGEVVANRVNNHMCRLQNITGASTVALGTTESANDSVFMHTRSVVSGLFTITAATVFELQHRCETTRLTDGYGTSATFGVVETYSTLEFFKLK